MTKTNPTDDDDDRDDDRSYIFSINEKLLITCVLITYMEHFLTLTLLAATCVICE